MTRSVSAAIQTALAGQTISPFYAVEFLLDDSPIRVWTGYGDRVINGQTYIGGGTLMSIGGLEETNDLAAKNITITLDGISSSLLSLALQTPIQNRSVRVYWGLATSGSPGYDAIEVFTGRANTLPFEDGGDTCVIQLTADSTLVRLERASNWRYTHESHLSRYPTDTFFSYVTKLQDTEVVWGRKSA